MRKRLGMVKGMETTNLTKEQKLAKWTELEKVWRGARSENQRGGYLAYCTKKANNFARAIAKLKNEK